MVAIVKPAPEAKGADVPQRKSYAQPPTTMVEEASLLCGYMPHVVRASTTSPPDRIFAASIIAQQRKGRPVTDRQVWRMRRMVERFRDMHMRGGDE